LRLGHGNRQFKRFRQWVKIMASEKPVLEIPQQIIFSDVNLDVLSSSPYELVYNEDSIKKSLETIFGTAQFSRVFRRRFGCTVMDLLFDPINAITASMIGNDLRTAAYAWEKRITEITVVVIPDYDNQCYYVDMTYRIPKLGDKMVSYKFNLSRGI